jgi:hypothetical protein
MARNYTQGQFQPKHPEKYEGNTKNIVFRSSWELLLFKWCDANPNIKKWSSEEVVIPYICKTDNKAHRYFMDCKMVFNNGTTLLVEVKPKAQTIPPKVTDKKRTKTLIEQVLTHTKNVSKWEAAQDYCKKRGWLFQIWTEDTLRSLGIRVGGTLHG